MLKVLESFSVCKVFGQSSVLKVLAIFFGSPKFRTLFLLLKFALRAQRDLSFLVKLIYL